MAASRSCRTRKCKKKSQHGHAGYCRACFRQRFPGVRPEKMNKTMETCHSCGKVQIQVEHGRSKKQAGHNMCQKCSRALLCKTKKCTTKAYAGYEGYCKACFRQRFPKAYGKKLKAIKKACRICGNSGFVRKYGICYTCTRARRCGKSDVVNMNPAAPACRLCRAMGQPERVAVSCSCFTEEERSASLCSTCLTQCNHCRSEDNMIKETFTCCEGSCGRSFRICVWCWPHLCTSESAVSVEKLQCKACWHRTGDLCVSCGRCKGQAHLNKFRRCANCCKQSSWEYCQACHHCNVTADGEDIQAMRAFTEYSCGAAGCETVFYLCRDCVYWFGIAADKFFGMLECKRCWHKSGDSCIWCGDRKAPRNRDAFRHCCGRAHGRFTPF